MIRADSEMTSPDRGAGSQARLIASILPTTHMMAKAKPTLTTSRKMTMFLANVSAAKVPTPVRFVLDTTAAYFTHYRWTR
jgi:hypothetical protein